MVFIREDEVGGVVVEVFTKHQWTFTLYLRQKPGFDLLIIHQVVTNLQVIIQWKEETPLDHYAFPHVVIYVTIKHVNGSNFEIISYYLSFAYNNIKRK